MYTYTAGSTGLDAAMPPWVQEGRARGPGSLAEGPRVRARVIAEMRDPAAMWENLYRHAGAEGTLLVGFTDRRAPSR
jgi:N-acyl-D-amino-acid deacylase